MENVKVTVWLSTYNQEPYVAQALESILMQKTDFPFEIVAADDCSTDRTQEIILDFQKRYPGKIVTYFTPENVGGCRKLTGCIDAGLFRGEFLSYLEGDDYWLCEDRLQTLVDFLEVHQEYAGAAHQREMVNEQGAFLCPDISEEILDRPFTIEDFLNGRAYSDFGAVFRNYYRTSGTQYHELLHASRNVCDLQDMFIIQDFGPVYVTSRCFGAYRCARQEGSTNYNSITTQAYRSMDHIHICRAIEDFYRGKYDLSPMIRREQGKLLRAVCERQDETEFSKAKPYLPKEAVIREMPKILYLALRGKRGDTIRFATRHMSAAEKLSAWSGVIPFAGRRVMEKLSGKRQESPDVLRGYLRHQDEERS